MSDQYVGEIRQVGFGFAPPGWLPCDGAIVSIESYEVLFSLIGTTYGGDGVQSFALPDLRGRTLVGAGTGPGLPSYFAGQAGGQETVTLSPAQLPTHTHAIPAQDNLSLSTQGSPANGVFGNSQGENQYGAPGSAVTAGILLPFGGNQSHENRMPYLVNRFIIATEGYYPSQG